MSGGVYAIQAPDSGLVGSTVDRSTVGGSVHVPAYVSYLVNYGSL